MTHILLLGRTGQLGWELARALPAVGELTAPSRAELDLTDLNELRRTVGHLAPEVIVNAAAYTDVDGAEHEPELAHRINAQVPRALAKKATENNSLLIHYSTDYVFDGEKNAPYSEEDPPNPINEYGRSKLAGEQAVQEIGGRHLILRTSWVYSTRRECFVTKVLRWARSQETIRIVSDQVGSPTWCRSLAAATIAALKRKLGDDSGQSGLYHAANLGAVSRHQLAEAVLAHDPGSGAHVVETLKPVGSEEFPTPAERPKFTGLDCTRFERTFGIELPPWEKALRQALQEQASGGYPPNDLAG